MKSPIFNVHGIGNVSINDVARYGLVFTSGFFRFGNLEVLYR
jgi:hypothetical protein